MLFSLVFTERTALPHCEQYILGWVRQKQPRALSSWHGLIKSRSFFPLPFCDPAQDRHSDEFHRGVLLPLLFVFRQAVVAEPFTLGRVLIPDAWQVEPFPLTIFTITADHLSE